MWVTKQLLVHIDFDSRKKKILWKSLWTSNCLVFHILQNSMYVQQKKETHSGLKLVEGVNDGINIKHYDIIDRQMTEFLFFNVKTTKHKEKKNLTTLD